LGCSIRLEKIPPAQTPDSVLDSDAHRQLALKLARESMVLLKNNGILPFAQKPPELPL